MRFDLGLSISIGILILISMVILSSIAPFVFPVYFIYLVLGLLSYLFFSQVSFGILSLFYKHFYVLTVVSLIIPLLVGQVTRGAARWIPVGALTIQPAEIVRPFLLVFFANFLIGRPLTLRKLLSALGFLIVPVILILFQPSLGVAVLTFVGFVGVLLACDFNKKSLLFSVIAGIALIPLLWFLLAPYQKERVLTFVDPQRDPTGAGYNSIQSMISVGSGKLLGRGLGEGVQTQLLFLPERHTDFVFASIAEEMGFLGSVFVLAPTFYLLYRIVRMSMYPQSPVARGFMAGVFLTLFTQTMVHIGMNMGLLPITGLPLPLVSAGGSSFVGTMTMLGMLTGARNRR